MCPIILELRSRGYSNLKVISTGQHKSMLTDALRSFCILPDVNLSIMRRSQSQSYVIRKLLHRLTGIYAKEPKSIVVVHGDTATAFSAALAAFLSGMPIAHVEAGLRTYDINEPYPEEFNRRAISLMSDINFAPSDEAMRNLIAEGIAKEKIFLTGNTVIDALKYNLDRCNSFFATRDNYALVTVHRRENLERLDSIFGAFQKIADRFPTLTLVYPVHKNPTIKRMAEKYLSGTRNIKLLSPLPTHEFHRALFGCRFVMTDSGGVTEEAAYLGKPIISLRDKSERSELTEHSGMIIAGTERENILAEVTRLIEDGEYYRNMSRPTKIYGSGDASVKIADLLIKM